ncbi:GGDEF domain-containing protein [Martelella soudanensis]|uniref:GGDEF domain-containing protein n=1 Tax=unclassified Martelella TaxID=2629616 RepID=UPI001FEE1312|nr:MULTISPECIES: GGDEF domain-containing protein [unclassified Martelella]
MDAVVARTILSLTGPGIVLIFSLAFAVFWLIERRLHYLPVLALSCLLFALGSLSQILHWPPEAGPNALVSGALYTIAVLLNVQGMLLRAEKPFNWWLCLIVFAIIMALLWYFFYIDRNLTARVYVQNFGYGLIMLSATVPLAKRPAPRPVDCVLFWVLLLFALQFFPRTLLTAGDWIAPDAAAFANSLFWQAMLFSVGLLAAVLALTLLFAAFSDVLHDLRRERDYDALTGVLNRRGFGDRIDAELPIIDNPVSLVLCDIDHFKSINDLYGHDQGDAVLRELGEVLRRNARKRDIIGRLGGEEFAILMPDTDGEAALQFAERLRIAVEGHHYGLPATANGVTASFGLATREPSESWNDLFKSADTRLYVAKRGGRNRVVHQDNAIQ